MRLLKQRPPKCFSYYYINLTIIFFVNSISSESLSKQVDTGKQQLWSCRANKQIVIVDSGSKSTDIVGNPSLPAMVLKDAIYKVEIRMEIFNFVVFLFLLCFIIVSLILLVICHMNHSYWMVAINDGTKLTLHTAQERQPERYGCLFMVTLLL